jgi:hypothetical protein
MADYAALIRPTVHYPFGLAINHFPRDQFVFEMRVAVDKAASLLFQLFRRRLGGPGSFKEFL